MARDGALMATAFDPSRFIAAEEERLSQTVAAPASALAPWAGEPKPLEYRDFLPSPPVALATLATLAGPDLSSLPFDGAVRRFVEQDCPPGVVQAEWDELTAEVWDVHRNWAQQAVHFGWSSLDLFGGNPDPFARRVDRDGLVLAIVGLRSPVRLVEITSDYAELSSKAGAPMRYRRAPRPGAVHVWEAYRMGLGP